jgi:hypothetical protein
MKSSFKLPVSLAVAVLIIGGTLLMSSHSVFFSNVRHFLSQLVLAGTQAAATQLGVSQGLPSYGGYPSPSSCNTGDSLCYPNTRVGVFSIVSQTNSNAGQTGYINFQNVTGTLGTPVTLQNINPTAVQWSCQNSQTVGTQYQSGSAGCGCVDTCGSWPNTYCCQIYCPVYSWSYQTYNFATNATISDPKGNILYNANGALYGSQNIVLGGPAGTYDAGQTINYSLSCVGTATKTVVLPVTMGSTITQTTLNANPTTVRAGLDVSMLTVTASSAAAGTCNIIGPDGSIIKNYSGSSVSDTVAVGPFGNQSTSQTFQFVCTGPEGFNSRKSVTLSVKLPPNLAITANNTAGSVIIPAGSSADIRWTSSNQTPNSCSVTYTATGGTCAAGAKAIPTAGAYGAKSFTVGSNTYLAIANAYTGTTYNTNSSIYKWIPGSACFGDDITCGVVYQSIPTTGAASWESFTVGSDTYLTVANSRNNTTRNVNSNIYKWMTGSACLGDGTTCGLPYQSIPTSGAVDLKPIVVGTDVYLAAANYRDDSKYTINSNIYHWMSSGASCPAGGGFGDGTTCGAVLQAIPTSGAYRMESFQLGGESYLAVSNSYDGGTTGYNLQSQIYKFIPVGTGCPAGGGFGNSNHHQCGTPTQSINTSGAYGFKYFTIGTISYLAIADSYDGSSFAINSKIYQWMNGSLCFGDGTTCGAAFETLPTNGATSLNTFIIGSNTYLVAANAYTGATYNTNSNIYQWMPTGQCFGNGATCGVAYQGVSTSGAAQVEPVTISGSVYLAFANYFNGTTRNINSSVMQWSPNGCGDSQLGTPTVWTGDQSPTGGDPTGIFSGGRLYTLSCKWLDGTTASSTSVNVVVLSQLTLTANGSTTNPVYITPNTSALVQWSSLNIQSGSCALSNSNDSTVINSDNNSAGLSTPVLANGNQITYTLGCTDLTGNPTTKSMAVIAATPTPVLSDMTISASRVLKGTRPTIKWNVQNIQAGLNCTITPTLQGGTGASTWNGTGTSWSSPVGGALGPVINIATTFTLTCTNKAGDSASVSAVANLIPAFKEI